MKDVISGKIILPVGVHLPVVEKHRPHILTTRALDQQLVVVQGGNILSKSFLVSHPFSRHSSITFNSLAFIKGK